MQIIQTGYEVTFFPAGKKSVYISWVQPGALLPSSPHTPNSLFFYNLLRLLIYMSFFSCFPCSWLLAGSPLSPAPSGLRQNSWDRSSLVILIPSLFMLIGHIHCLPFQKHILATGLSTNSWSLHNCVDRNVHYYNNLKSDLMMALDQQLRDHQSYYNSSWGEDVSLCQISGQPIRQLTQGGALFHTLEAFCSYTQILLPN